MSARSVVIIGAGIGGLTAAANLRRAGLHVTVLEKNAGPGGRCQQFEREGHRFDTGPTLLVMPLLYAAEFRHLGTSLREQLNLQRVDPTYTLVFGDGRRLALTSDMRALAAQLEAFEPGSRRGLLRYVREGREHYRLAMESLVNRDYRSASDFFAPRNLALLLRLKPLVNHYRNMAAYFDDPRLKAAFTFQDLYMGISPFEAPATFSLLPFTELAHGVWYPPGGMVRIVEALAGLARSLGVEFAFASPVERIETNASHARAVMLAGGGRIPADVVLANADLPYVYNDLLPRDGAARRLARKRYSCSVISFFWGVDKVYQALGPHTLFLVDDYRGNFEAIIDDLALAADPSVYVHAPARLDPSMAPPGHDTLTAIVPVGHLSPNDDQDWAVLRDQARAQVFRKLRLLGITDLEAHIKFEETYTPIDWRDRYNLVRGSTHGLSHTLTQMAWFRPRNRHARYRNLYFVGASTHPGTGVPTAMVSGRLAAQRILDEQLN